MREHVRRQGPIPPEAINENSASVIIKAFQSWKNDSLHGHFKYIKGKTPPGATALSRADGTPRADIEQVRIGMKLVPGEPCSRYLYGSIACDSPLEKRNILEEIQEVVVYGKIPRCSIAIPTTTGGTFSPDFMYVVKKKNGEKEMNIVVETKDVSGVPQLRKEEMKIKCAKVFFKTLEVDGFNVVFRTQNKR